MKRILWATDGSKVAKEAGYYAKEFLKSDEEARITVVYVSPDLMYPLTKSVEEEYAAREDEFFAALQEELRNEVLYDVPDRVQFEHLYGQPEQVICDLATSRKMDLVVVGCHGKTLMERVMMGSVSQNVAQHALVPVLVVKAG
ncbi:MAG: universal stress protein [Alicyclobacillus sp.]|nr:universal stress protein [Alicyclobacillus sp.]